MAGMLFVGLHSLPALIAATILLGITYAGTANIVLNGLGVALSPRDNPGILPGLNAGAFNLGAALSFVILPAVQLIGSPAGSSSSTGYFWAILVGLIITLGALGTSFLIPRPSDAEAPKRAEAEVTAGSPSTKPTGAAVIEVVGSGASAISKI
jgi:hypothetical protein